MSLEREKTKIETVHWCTGALFDILKRLTRLTGIVDTFPEKVDFLLKRLMIFLQISIYFRNFVRIRNLSLYKGSLGN